VYQNGLGGKQNLVARAQEPKIILIPKGRRLLDFGKERMNLLKESLDLLTSEKNLIGWIEAQRKAFKEIENRNIRIRLISQVKESGTQSQMILGNYLSEDKFEIRFYPTPLCTHLGIYDNKEVIMRLDPEAAFLESCYLWTNNPCLVEMGRAYFEKIWNISVAEKT